jgi:hypothetical protein
LNKKGYGGMVDTQDLGPCNIKDIVRVQVPLSIINYMLIFL